MKLSVYQQEAVDKLIEPRKPTHTYACFDPPGIGKTAIDIHAHLALDRFPALITMPAHLVLQWRDELIRWGVPKDEIAYCPRGMKPIDRMEMFSRDAAFQLVTYNMWTQPTFRDLLQHRSWGSYSFDEAHRLRKGHKGKGGLWLPVSQLRTKTRTKHMSTPLWMLSGTPIVKSVDDVFPLLHLANPYRYTSRPDFAKEWCRTSNTPYGMHVGPLRENRREEFYELLGKYSIRRNWRDIPELRNLKKRDIPLPVELDTKELARHRAIKKNYRDPVTGEPVYSSSAMIHLLRQITMPSKIDSFKEIVEDSPPGRWLVVAWYRDSAKLTYDRVRANHPHTVYIDGGTSEKERQLALRRYQDHSDTIMVATLGSIETGLNLQAGSNFAFLESHWLSTTNEQAVGRLLRRGQSQPVLVYNIFCPKTFDMRVKRVSEKRGADIERALDEYLAEDEEDLS
jgi:SNF2 family DNA or RNA helicase